MRDRNVSTTAAVAHWVRSYRVESSASLWLLTSPPLCREQAGGGIARRVAGRTPASGSSGRMPCRSTPPPVCVPAGARHRGGLSFGYFSLAKQRKVTRAAAAVRKPAVPRDSLRSQASHLAVSLQPETEALGDSLRSPLRAYYALRAPSGLRQDDEQWRPRRKTVAHRVRSYKGKTLARVGEAAGRRLRPRQKQHQASCTFFGRGCIATLTRYTTIAIFPSNASSFNQVKWWNTS